MRVDDPAMPFRSVMRADEILLWSARPVLHPLPVRRVIVLSIVAIFGAFGLLGVAQGILAKFDIGDGPLVLLKSSPGGDFLIFLGLNLLALVWIGTTISDRETTKQRIYALSREHAFSALVSAKRQSCTAAALVPDGQIEATRQGGLVSVSVEIKGQAVEDFDPYMFEFADLDPADAERLLQTLKQPEVPQ